MSYKVPDQGYVVFSGPGCPNCTTLKNSLTAKGIQFTEVNVRENEEARGFLLEQGFRGIPQLYVNGVHSQLNG
jgi:glutaredoxin-like protein NrdH